MKWQKALLGAVIFVILVVAIVVGFFANRDCISFSFAQYIIFGLTLVAALLYAYFTYEILGVQKDVFQLSQDPVIVSWIKPDFLEYSREDRKKDYKTIFFIENLSGTHAVAKININPEVDGKEARSNEVYFGKKWWYVPAGKTIQGWFPLLEILESVEVDLDAFHSRYMPLKLKIKVDFRIWDIRKENPKGPVLRNPPDKWYFDHILKKWVHDPTRLEID